MKVLVPVSSPLHADLQIQKIKPECCWEETRKTRIRFMSLSALNRSEFQYNIRKLKPFLITNKLLSDWVFSVADFCSRCHSNILLSLLRCTENLFFTKVLQVW